MNRNPEMCKNCNERPRFGTFDYCGKRCAEEARAKAGNGGILTSLGNFFFGPLDEDPYERRGSSGRTGTYASVAGGPNARREDLDDNICEECRVRPKNRVFDPATGQTIVYPHCGIQCRNIAAQKNIKKCITCKKDSRGDFCSETCAKKAVAKRVVKGCLNCKTLPANPPYEYCSKQCGMIDAAKRQQRGQVGSEPRLEPLVKMDPLGDTFRATDKRFRDRWQSDTVGVPEIESIYRINLPSKYERRFKDAIEQTENFGGSTTKSAFYGGQCICDMGTKEPAELCNWKSCSICIVIRTGFDKLEFGNTEHKGKHGKGIYAHVNPAMAHRWTVRKASNPLRAIILCSIIEMDSHSRDKRHGANTDETGRVFCSSKSYIIPRSLIIYNDPSPLGA